MHLLSWLSTNGFVDNPFAFVSLHAETDRLLDSLLYDQYLQRDDIDLLVGNFDAPGYRFIVAGSGGGKSAVRLQIHLIYEQIDQFSDKPRALILDYILPEDPDFENNVSHHVKHILNIAEQKLGNVDLTKEKKLAQRSPKRALELLVNDCRKMGFEGVYCLVDNLSPQKTLALATASRLFDIHGFILKFFISDNPISLVGFASAFIGYPPCHMRWDERSLALALNTRLNMFLDPKFRSSTVVPGVSFLCVGHTAADVQDYFIKVGKYGGGPGLMWEFGSCLFEEHMKLALGKANFINHESFTRARTKLFDKIVGFNPGLGSQSKDNVEKKFSGLVKTSTNAKRKAKVFIHCLEDDKEVIYRTLYQNLDADNYRPWMASLDLLAGENRRFVIESEIKASRFFIPCLSLRSITARGEFVRFLRLALEIQKNELLSEDIFIIPFIIEKCDIPEELREFECFDRNNKDYFSNLLRSIEKGMSIRKEFK